MLSQAAAPQFPQAELSSSSVHATLYLPDAQSGYYRGTRFDWSGAIASLKWNGHEYFGQWFERHDPKIHDAIMGPVEEFLTGPTPGSATPRRSRARRSCASASAPCESPRNRHTGGSRPTTSSIPGSGR